MCHQRWRRKAGVVQWSVLGALGRLLAAPWRLGSAPVHPARYADCVHGNHVCDPAPLSRYAYSCRLAWCLPAARVLRNRIPNARRPERHPTASDTLLGGYPVVLGVSRRDLRRARIVRVGRVLHDLHTLPCRRAVSSWYRGAVGAQAATRRRCLLRSIRHSILSRFAGRRSRGRSKFISAFGRSRRYGGWRGALRTGRAKAQTERSARVDVASRADRYGHDRRVALFDTDRLGGLCLLSSAGSPRVEILCTGQLSAVVRLQCINSRAGAAGFRGADRSRGGGAAAVAVRAGGTAFRTRAAGPHHDGVCGDGRRISNDSARHAFALPIFLRHGSACRFCRRRDCSGLFQTIAGRETCICVVGGRADRVGALRQRIHVPGSIRVAGAIVTPRRRLSTPRPGSLREAGISCRTGLLAFASQSIPDRGCPNEGSDCGDSCRSNPYGNRGASGPVVRGLDSCRNLPHGAWASIEAGGLHPDCSGCTVTTSRGVCCDQGHSFSPE